jgi:tRNA:m4X modification enzyme
MSSSIGKKTSDAAGGYDKTKMAKHLLVCNARIPENPPPYIKTGANLGEAEEVKTDENFKLQDLSPDELNVIIKKVESLFDKYLTGQIQNSFMSHEVLAEELANEEYGNEKRRHLVQTSSILGILKSENLLKPKTSFIEYGAGKAALTFWLATAIKPLENVKVLVIDRASHRFKKDNKMKVRLKKVLILFLILIIFFLFS